MLKCVLILALIVLGGCAAATVPDGGGSMRVSKQSGPLRIAVIGMVHGHVEGLLWRGKSKEVEIVGVWEPNRALFDRLAAKYGLDASLYFDDLGVMLDRTKPEAASVMTSIAGHVAAVEACAPRGVHVLVEKPLAFTNEDASRMAELSKRHGILVLTNYETSWYASVREAKRMVEAGMSPVRKMVFRHGHKGPREIGCPEEFLAWLTDPKENGGGAIVDFGCYGAGLATWMMDGQRPLSVTASAANLKPDVYPNVDDDATMVLTYPTATAVIQASWAWTHDNKEMDVFTEKGAVYCGKWDEMTKRAADKPAVKAVPAKKPAAMEHEWEYLRRVVRGECAVDPLSSLENNVIVVEILDAARRQVRRRGG